MMLPEQAASTRGTHQLLLVGSHVVGFRHMREQDRRWVGGALERGQSYTPRKLSAKRFMFRFAWCVSGECMGTRNFL